MTNPPSDPPTRAPVEVLDELLKQKTAVAELEPVSDPAAAEAAQQAETEALKAKREEIDRTVLLAQQENLASIKDTPEYQARMQQQETAKQQAEVDKAAHEGFGIQQLNHTKIEE